MTHPLELNRRPKLLVLILFLFTFLTFPSPSTSAITIPQIRMPFKTVLGQAITTTQWYVRGKSHFTATGYLKHIKNYNSPVQSSVIATENDNDGVDMTGKVVIVTGANSGIGKELATYAADKGANVYMLCRSAKRAEAARDEIIKATKNSNVKVLLADVQELDQIRNVAKEIQSIEDRIDCLVCNAGVLLNDRQESKEGIETTFASHFLGGSYLLSKLLLPQLRKASSSSTASGNANESKDSFGPRVIFVSSGGMLNSKFPDWETATSTGSKKEEYDGNMAYTYAKRGQVLLAERFTKEYPDITWLSCHPGWTSTDAVQAAYGDTAKYLEPMRSTWQGAEGIAWLMSTPKANLKSGEFYLDRMPDQKHIAGPFMTSGSFTKNTEQEVDVMMENLKRSCDGV